MILLIVAAVIIGWGFYRYDRNGFGAPQMKGMTHAEIAQSYRRAFLDDELGIQELFENHWGDAYGTEEWVRFETRVLEYMVSKEDNQARERLGFLFMHRDGDQWKKGLEYMEQAANEGSISAMEHLARFYGRPTELSGKAYDPQKEVLWYKKASDAGSVEAKYSLHFNYLTGEGVERDDKKAIQCLYEAMECGHQKAKVRYARHQYGDVIKESYDPYKAIDLLKEVLLMGDVEAIAEAALELGTIYGGGAVFGIHNPQSHENVEEALRYFHLAKRIDPDTNATEWYRSLMINTGNFVDEKTEKQWIRLENEILRIGDEV